MSRKEAGFDTIEKLKAATGIRVGAQSVGFVTYNAGARGHRSLQETRGSGAAAGEVRAPSARSSFQVV
ncbi:MAG: hypothetical protein ABWZ17_06035 [Candidatus Binatia bacterium]